MAGFIQTGTLVDGQWMTTNVDVNTVLERHMERKKEEFQSETDKTPVFGLLTQTVVDSPVIHWILPARIRSINYHDIAFIGDQFVQIRRLGNDGQLHDVARKADFGCRIRNAHIIGLSNIEADIPGHSVSINQIKDESGDVHMADASGPKSRPIPPQFILLALESGDLICLFARNVGVEVEFVTSRHRVARRLLTAKPGKHLAVDPSSRYLAVAGFENIFAVYALHSTEVLATQYLQGEPFRPIASERYFHVRGVIHKMEFLFPSPDDPDHIILLLIVVKSGSTSMFVFEWVAGQSLTEIRSHNSRGHTLALNYRMPLLLIPLTLKSAFLLVSAQGITECKSLLEGSPECRDVPLKGNATSPLHMGPNIPLWTSWTRPLRTRSYSKSHDDIYIAREDGFVAFLEIDSEGRVQAQMEAGNFRCNIGTAFTSLEVAFPGPDGSTGDFLVTGGDSGNGGVYLVAARQLPQLVEPIPNWSPVVDFVTTAKMQGGGHLSRDSSEPSKRRRLALDEPVRIFACTGRGSHGAVSEIRYGHEARLRLDVAGLDVPITETWVLPFMVPSRGDTGFGMPSPLLFLLSVGGQSLLLHLTADTRAIEEVAQSSTWLDLTSRTLAAAACNGLIVQITERSINISSESAMKQTEDTESSIYREEYPPSKAIVAAAVYQNELALVVFHDDSGGLYLSGLRIHMGAMSKEVATGKPRLEKPTVEVLGSPLLLTQYPNSISIVKQSDGVIYGIICASRSSGARNPDLCAGADVLSLSAIFKLEDNQGLVRIDPIRDYWALDQSRVTDAVPEACVSIAYLRGLQTDLGQPELLLAGYRSGLLVMRHYKLTSEGNLQETKISQYPIGSTPVTIKVDPLVPYMALVCCDSKLWRVTYDCLSQGDPQLHRVWFTDFEHPLHLQPSVNHVSILPHGLLLTAGKQLLMTWLEPQAKPILRTMKLLGPPNRILYSHRLEILIVALSIEGRSTFTFLEPESGDYLGRHCDSAGNLLKFPSGLGISGEKILSLVEWEWKDATTKLNLIIVGTSTGGLLLYQTEKHDQAQFRLAKEEIRCIAYCEEHYESPVFTVVTCAASFFCCVGETVRWVSLDKSGKALETHAEYKLPSRAVSMSVEGHWLNVLTVKHSLITLLLVDRKKHPRFNDQHGQLVSQFADEIERNGLDQVSITNDSDDQISKDSTLVIVADKDCSVAGLWYCKKGHPLVRNHNTVFEANLPSSILKFRTGMTRPPWDIVWKRGGLATSTHHGGELLGMGIDGSMRHFTLLQEQVWCLLRFLQDLAHRSGDTTPLADNPIHSGNKMDLRKKHIDGDLLRPYLSHRRLERLLMADEARSEGGTDSQVVEEFCSLVNSLYDGDHIPPRRLAERSLETCLEDVYRLLGTLLRPVL